MLADLPSKLVFQHGIGGTKDLPIPAQYAIAGAAAALAISFVVLALAWRTPRFDAATMGVPVPRGLQRFIDSAGLAWGLRLFGLAFAGYVGWAALSGPDLIINPFFGVIYVLLWVGLVPMSVLFGPFYKAVNPVRTVHLLLSKVTGSNASDGILHLPRRVGLWPGALGLFAFVWMELVYPRAVYLVDLRLWCAIYIAVVFIGAAVFGDKWIAAADPFEVFSTLVGRLCIIGRRTDGVLTFRSPLGNLDGTPPSPGLVGVVSVLFGSTAFDSFKDSPRWTQVTQTGVLGPLDVSWSKQTVNTVGLVAFILVVLVTFVGATTLTGIKEGSSRWALPNQFAHSVVPIVVGYVVAHYLSYFIIVGQQTLAELSDPMARGDNYLGTANLTVDQWILLHPSFLAVVKVLSVVVGHILGVISAHDRAIKLLPKRHQLTGQLPLLLVMVFYTVTGLYLLLSA